MFINGKEFVAQELEYKLVDAERSKKYGQFFYEGKSGGYCIGIEGFKKLIKEHMRGNRYIEVGTFDGVALSILAEIYPDREFYAIDAFIKGAATQEGCLKYFIGNCAKYNNIHLYIGTSVDVKFKLEGKFDFVFIDGDHSYEWVKKDIGSLWPFVEDNGIMVFHDYNHPQIRDAIQSVFPVKDIHKWEHGEYMFVLKGKR